MRPTRCEASSDVTSATDLAVRLVTPAFSWVMSGTPEHGRVRPHGKSHVRNRRIIKVVLGINMDVFRSLQEARVFFVAIQERTSLKALQVVSLPLDGR